VPILSVTNKTAQINESEKGLQPQRHCTRQVKSVIGGNDQDQLKQQFASLILKTLKDTVKNRDISGTFAVSPYGLSG